MKRPNHIKQHMQAKSKPVFRITWKALQSVATTIGTLPAETGGALGGDETGEEITRFHFDGTARSSSATYSPDTKLLNQLFKSEWNPHDIRLKGFVHSHPGGYSRPSHGDEIYAEQILLAIPDLQILWLPIINTIADTGGFRLTPWAAELNNGKLSIIRGAVQVVGIPRKASARLWGMEASSLFSSGSVLDEIVISDVDTHQAKASLLDAPLDDACQQDAACVCECTRIGRISAPMEIEPPARMGINTFQRVQEVYDLPLLNASRVIAVGAGGAAEWLEQLARTGLGQFVLIDPDTVAETNLATQQTYRRDIGRPKVDCIAERIRDINPRAQVVTIQKLLDDLSDSEIANLANDPIDGVSSRRTILAGLTDSFMAQARVNRLALQYSLPSLCAQVYKEGRGAEITFTFPGVTPACHRCILSLRYKHYLEQRGGNDVTSHGTPIFATARLNATKGFIALALLHHGSEHPRWGDMLTRIGKRNLVVVRMDPDFATTIGMRTFDKVFANADVNRLFFDESIWLPQEAESPLTGHAPCPDCGGTGDLRQSIGKFRTTVLNPIDGTARDYAQMTEPGAANMELVRMEE